VDTGDRPALDDPTSLGAWLAEHGATAPFSALHAAVAGAREREQAESLSRRRDEWTRMRGAAHLALAHRGSRVALYDLREAFDVAGQPLPADFLKRRTAGNAIEALGIVAFRASPVWVLAALADVCGMGRQLIQEIADALKAQGLLDRETTFSSVDEMLDGLERTSSRLAGTVNTPPLDVATLREEWQALRQDARRLQPQSMPSPAAISDVWRQLRDEAARQERSVFETSSMMAVSAIKAVPDGARWLSASVTVGAARTGQLAATALLDHYRTTLEDIRQTGYATFAARQLGPYVRAAVGQFSPERVTLTERLLARRGTPSAPP
jgi:hypothetical protein